MKSTLFTLASASYFNRATSAIRSSYNIAATSCRRTLAVTATVAGLFAAAPDVTACGTVTSVAPGNFNNPATWGGVVPTSCDQVIIAHAVNLNVPFTIGSGTTGSMTINAGGSLSGANGLSLVVGFPIHTLTNNGTLNIASLTLNGGATGGQFSNGGTATIQNNLTALSNTSINNTGALTINGNLILDGARLVNIPGSSTITIAGTMTMQGNPLPVIDNEGLIVVNSSSATAMNQLHGEFNNKPSGKVRVLNGGWFVGSSNENRLNNENFISVKNMTVQNSSSSNNEAIVQNFDSLMVSNDLTVGDIFNNYSEGYIGIGHDFIQVNSSNSIMTNDGFVRVANSWYNNGTVSGERGGFQIQNYSYNQALGRIDNTLDICDLTPTIPPLQGTRGVVDRNDAGTSKIDPKVTICEYTGSHVPSGNCANAKPSPITGPKNPCPGTIVTYSVSPRADITSYTWTVPQTWTILSGQGTYQITVKVGTKPSVVKCKIVSSLCGTKVRTMHVKPSKNPLGVVGNISGLSPFSKCETTLCGYSYTIDPVKGALSYDWTTPAGISITSGQGTTSITVCFDASIAPGNYVISVTVGNICGSASATKTVVVEACCPALSGGPMSGPAEINACLYVAPSGGMTGVPSSPYLCGLGTYATYTIPALPAGTTYTWYTTTGVNINSGQGTNSVDVCLDSTTLATLESTIWVIVSNDCFEDSVGMLIETDCDIFPLPVELVSFDVKAEKAGARLNWRTVQEIDNKGFEVQRSADGKTFSTIGWTNAIGNSAGGRYQYLDQKPLNGLSYYRLKQVDNSGKFEYSPVRSIRTLPALGELSVYPNPTPGLVNLSMPNSLDSRSTLSLTAADGKVLWTQTLEAGQNLPTELDLSKYPAGIYLLSLSGSEVQHLRITKE